MAKSLKLTDNTYWDTGSIKYSDDKNYDFTSLIRNVLAHYNNTNTYWCRLSDINAVPDLYKFAFYYYDAGTANIPDDFAPYGALIHIPTAFNKQILIGNWANSTGNWIKVRTRVGADVGGTGNWDAWQDLYIPPSTVRNDYSTSETIIGTYKGVPLYRKIVDIGTVTFNGGEKLFAHGISGLDRVVHLEYSMYYPSNGRWYKNWDCIDTLNTTVDSTYIRMNVDSNVYNTTFYYMDFVIEYTK